MRPSPREIKRQKAQQKDTGIARYYGAHKGVLELTAEGAIGIYGDQRIPIQPKIADVRIICGR